MAQSKSAEQTSRVRQIFNDLSFPQVTAGALAAVTSMLLASNVGIAGTVIGVAVSSVVSAVASQVYKQFILASAEKVKDLAPTGLIPPGAHSHKEGIEERPGLMEEVTVPAGWATTPERRTRVFNPREIRRTEVPASYVAAPRTRAMRAPSAARYRSVGVSMGDEYARSAILQARAARERKAKIQRNTVLVAVVSAVVAVVVCALMIDVVTQGRGLGPQMPTATYMQKWNTASSQQDGESAESGGDESSSEDEKKTESSKGNSSTSEEKESATKPNSGVGSVSGSSSGSSSSSPGGSSDSGSSGAQAPQSPQVPGSSGANGDESGEVDSESQDDGTDTSTAEKNDASRPSTKPTAGSKMGSR